MTARRKVARLLVPDATPGVGPVGRAVSAAVPLPLLAWPTMLYLGWQAAGWQGAPVGALSYWQTLLAILPLGVGMWVAREVMIRRRQHAEARH